MKIILPWEIFCFQIIKIRSTINTASCVTTVSEHSCCQYSTTWTPTQHALFLAHIATLNFDADDNEKSVQRNFDDFYETLLGLLETFYPERTITVSNRDPDFITADIGKI